MPLLHHNPGDATASQDRGGRTGCDATSDAPILPQAPQRPALNAAGAFVFSGPGTLSMAGVAGRGVPAGTPCHHPRIAAVAGRPAPC